MKWKGSYTIEMALIMPIILLTLVSFFVLAFRMHDAAVLRAMAYELLILENESMENAYGLILDDSPPKSVVVTGNKVSAEVKGIDHVLLERKRTKQVSFIRKCRKAAALLKESEE